MKAMFGEVSLSRNAHKAAESAVQLLGWRAGVDGCAGGTEHTFSDLWGRGYLLGTLDQLLRRYRVSHSSAEGLSACYAAVQAVANLDGSEAREFFWEGTGLYGTQDFEAGVAAGAAGVDAAFASGHLKELPERGRFGPVLSMLTYSSVAASLLAGTIQVVHLL